MTNTSATGGYLAPIEATPEWDAALDDILQTLVMGVTGLPGASVRPRWEAKPAARPPLTENWCSIGVMSITQDDNAVISHIPDGDGTDELQRHETLDVLASFYGPGANGYAARLRDGLWIAQNREIIADKGLGVVSVGQAIIVPNAFNQENYRRIDLPVTMRRSVTRTYRVLNVLTGVGEIIGGDNITPFDTSNPQR